MARAFVAGTAIVAAAERRSSNLTAEELIAKLQSTELEDWQVEAIDAILNFNTDGYSSSSALATALDKIDPHYIPSLVDPDY